ncbi:MAG: hypothetical protein AAFV53_19715 [Myxococcota bacterium]
MRLSLLSLMFVACEPDRADPAARAVDPGVGLVGDHPLNPFPASPIAADGVGLLDPAQFPMVDTPLPVDRFAYRTGYSRAQISVVRLPEVRADALCGTTAAPTAGDVWLVDLDTGERLPCFAELDAHPDAAPPALLIRPQLALPVGHPIGVAVTLDATARPERFDWLVKGAVTEAARPEAASVQQLLQQLDDVGLPADEVAVAWSFMVDAGTAPLASVVSQVAAPSAWRFDRTRDADQGDTVQPATWRVLEGSFTTADFLVDDALLNIAADGSVRPTGEVEARLYVHVPASARDAEPGTVPVMLFGHGILADPAIYLDADDDPSNVVALAEAGGYIVVGTVWRGLTRADAVDTLSAARDIGRFPEVPDRLAQGVANTVALARLVREGGLLNDPLLANADGEPLGDPARLVYYGISLGGIEGAVALAAGLPVDAAVFHVGGASWSTMLERSSNWSLFEPALVETIPDPWERQLSYAATQLFWDPVDPIAWAAELQGRDFLLQEAIGDEQVPNMTTEMLARSTGLPMLTPSATTPFDLEAATSGATRALSQFDPETALPAIENRPATVTGAHTTPRLWEGAHAQTLTYLETGEVVHTCGGDPCSASNTGAEQ